MSLTRPHSRRGPHSRRVARAALTSAAAALVLAGVSGIPASASPAPVPADPDGARLLARSILPTETYVPGSERSGYWTTGNAQIPAPYPGQPVQGFSATHAFADGSYLVMSDNGFGAKTNSADFILSVHHIRPDLREGRTGPGRTAYLSTPIRLTDPDRKIPWTIWRDGGCQAAPTLPAGYTCPARDRLLTGWDFDPESMQIAADGTIWLGEEFGPYLLHTDRTGRLLDPPIQTPGVKSPSNPTLAAGETANLPNSKGFEGMAIAPDLRTLHPMLEGATAEDKTAGRGTDLRVYTVTTRRTTPGTSRSAAGQPAATFRPGYVYYRMESADHAIGDFIMVNATQGLVIERDNLQGDAARFKRIYLVDLSKISADNVMSKTLLVDLMKVPDPTNAGGLGDPFTFPYFTIEDVEIIDSRTITVMNDNNFPAMGGRGPSVPDVNEQITIRLPYELRVHPRLLPTRRS